MRRDRVLSLNSVQTTALVKSTRKIYSKGLLSSPQASLSGIAELTYSFSDRIRVDAEPARGKNEPRTGFTFQKIQLTGLATDDSFHYKKQKVRNSTNYSVWMALQAAAVKPPTRTPGPEVCPFAGVG